MRTSPTIAGGGSGFTASPASTEGFSAGQTSGATQSLTFTAEL